MATESDQDSPNLQDSAGIHSQPEPHKLQRSYFSLSLLEVRRSKWKQIVKSRLRVNVRFTLTDGGQFHRSWAADAIIIRRTDVETVYSYSESHCGPRNRLLIRLPRKIGLRTSEVCTLAAEHIDFNNREFQVLDSKKKRLFPSRLDVMTLQLIEDLLNGRNAGPVFQQRESWKYAAENQPLSRVQVWQITRDIGLAAGVKGMNPRKFREFFAAEWYYVNHKNIVTLQRIMRHKHPGITLAYVERMVFWEDVVRDFDSIQNDPIVAVRSKDESVCPQCHSLPVCRFAPLPASQCPLLTRDAAT